MWGQEAIKQPIAEDIQDLDVLIEHDMLQEVQMSQLHLHDPLVGDNLLTRNRSSVSVDNSTIKSESFKLDGVLSVEEVNEQMGLLRHGLDLVNKLSDPTYTAHAEYAELDSIWLQRMMSFTPNPKSFKAGRMHACVPVLEEYFALICNKSRNAGKVIKWFKEGVKLKFVGVHHPSHQQAPQFNQEMEAVRSMLSKAIGSEQVEQYLTETIPHAVQSPNYKSVHKYADLCRKR